LAETKLKDSSRYRDGFKPKFIASELKKQFKPGEFVFVSDMGDISFASEENMLQIVSHTGKFPQTNFLIQTKNPGWLKNYFEVLPTNVYMGTTIESNYNYPVTKAPPPRQRYDAMLDLRRLTGLPRFLSIEPIIDFDLGKMVSWVFNIQPAIIEVGADNYGHSLPEPSWDKVVQLLAALRAICPDVNEKEGLERLKK